MGWAKRDRSEICWHGKESARYDRATCLTTVPDILVIVRFNGFKITSSHAMNLITLRAETIGQLLFIDG